MAGSGSAVYADSIVRMSGNAQCLDASGLDYGIPNQSDINASTTYRKSIAFWFSPDSANITQGIYEEGGSTHCVSIYVENDTLYFVAVIFKVAVGIASYSGIEAGGLYHVVCQLDCPNNIFTLHVNGDRIYSDEHAIGTSFPAHSGDITFFGSFDAVDHRSATSNKGSLNGKIEDFIYWANAAQLLTDEEIKLIFEAGNGIDYIVLSSISTSIATIDPLDFIQQHILDLPELGVYAPPYYGDWYIGHRYILDISNAEYSIDPALFDGAVLSQKQELSLISEVSLRSAVYPLELMVSADKDGEDKALCWGIGLDAEVHTEMTMEAELDNEVAVTSEVLQEELLYSDVGLEELAADIVGNVEIDASISSTVSTILPYIRVRAAETLARFAFCTATGRVADAKQDVYGIADAVGVQNLEPEVLAGADADLANEGSVTNPAWSFTAGLPVFLGEGGVPTQAVPAAPEFFWNVVLGTASGPNTLVLDIGDPIRLRNV